MFSLKRRKLIITQASIRRESGLQVQTFVTSWIRISESLKEEQATLDKWFECDKKSMQQQPQHQNSSNTQSKPWVLEYWDDTITCIELDMKHDKSGYLVDWMKGAVQGDSWDGTVDNQEQTLEKHVSKHGWEF
ncbi:MAG: hypothetical protein QXQ41_03525 [Candidatus Bathyarchaeia archaeon]